MNERLAKAEALFHDALELPADQRDAFLQQACAEDPQLRREVAALLRASGIADDWLCDADAGHVAHSAKSTVLETIQEGPGTVIGRYKLLEWIGEGGFGVVYMAEQQEPVRRRVALKIIKLGMDTRSVIARFEAERQALAMMDHPNIAKVLDAGATDTGRPYFVMELVRGIPITKFCEENRLGTKQRLDLFIQVCAAIQHAHHKGIIHRDIKPTNVLVTMNDGVPHPMVIDFGVAKAINQRLTEKTLFTNFAQMIGTPAYMSPEQAEMSKLDVDTRSDVYSLGVLLYELLTGTTPFSEERLRSAGYAEMQRIIVEEEPEKPSTRASKTKVGLAVLSEPSRAGRDPRYRPRSKVNNPKSEIDRDLDWVIMKCLEKDRTRRYDTASALVLDIQRHLNNEPILASPPSKIYRLQKLVRRNKLAFTAVAAVVTALLFGVVVTSWQAFRATRAEREQSLLRAQAEKARTQAEQKAQESRRNLYAADMILAQGALEAGNVGRAKELLRTYLPLAGEKDLRGWEWRYAWNQCRSDELFTLEGHDMNLTSLALASNGRILASGSQDRTVMLWDLHNTNRIKVLPQSDSVYSLSFSKDDKELIVGTMDGQVAFWNCETWQQVDTLTNLSWVRGLAVSPDGKILAVFGTRFLTLWDSARRQELARFELLVNRDRAPGGLAFSPDSSLLAYSKGDGKIVLWHLAKAKALAELEGHERYVAVLAFSPDGSILVSGARDRTARVWDIRSGREIRQLGNFAGWVGSIAFSPDGGLLALAGSGQRLILFNTRSWEVINTFRGHFEDVLATVFTRDGRTILTAAKDRTIKGWAVTTNQQPASLRLPADASSAFLFPDAKRLYLTHTDAAYSLWRIDPFRELERHPINLPHSTFSRIASDGRFWAAVTTNNFVKIFERSGERLVADLPDPVVSTYRFGFAFSPDGQTFASVGIDHTCRIWRAVSHSNVKPDIQLSASSRGLLQQIAAFEISARTLSVLKFLGDGSLIGIGGWDGETEVWNTVSTQKVATLRGHTWSVVDITISRNGSIIATAGGDGRVKIWDLKTRRELATLGGQLNTCFSVAFSPDESRIAACGGDGTVRLWDTETKQEVACLKIHNHLLHQLAFSHGDDSLVVLAADELGHGRLFVLRAPRASQR